MEDFGCIYMKNFDVCRRIPGTSEVSSQCERVGNRCVISKGEDKAEEVIVVPTAPTLQEKTAVPAKQGGKPNFRLSGPVSAYSGEYAGKKYYFFGDAHFSTKGICSTDCANVDPITFKNYPENPDDCVDIVRYLKDLFIRRGQQDQYTDFFLEIPFMPKENMYVTKEDINYMSQRTGYIGKIAATFWDCFIKANCPVPKTRFHYVDLRTKFYPDTISIQAPEMYITSTLMQQAADNLVKMYQRYMMYNQTLPQDELIEAVNFIVKDFYQSGGQTMKGVVPPKNVLLFRAYLESDNIYEDVNNLFSQIYVRLPPRDLIEFKNTLLPEGLIVVRDGKQMFRARAQLWALEQEGKGDMARKIKEYAFRKFDSLTDSYKITTLWTKVMKLYNVMTGQTKSRVRAMGDDYIDPHVILEELMNLQSSLLSTILSNVYLMDVYMLARMFRTFPGTGHIDSTTAIVYAGDAHIDNYVDFFEEVLRVSFIKHRPNSMFTNVDSIIRCVNIDIKDFD